MCISNMVLVFVLHHQGEQLWQSLGKPATTLTLFAALLVGWSRDRFPVVSLVFSVTYAFQMYHGPGVNSAPSKNEYQEHFLGVKAAGA